MSRLLLFAETPRAGRWNYRFLVPAAAPVSQDDLQRYASAAHEQADGPDYLAVRREGVKQVTTERQSAESLVLAGRALGRMSAADREALRGRLRRYLDELEELITRQIDWEREGLNLVVPRPELDAWLADLMRIPRWPARRGGISCLAKMLVAMVLLVLLAVLVGPHLVPAPWFRLLPQPQPPAGPSPGQPETRKTPASDALHLKEWTRILHLSPASGSASQDQLYQAIAQSLARRLFVPDTDGATDSQDAAGLLQQQLRCLDQLRFSQERPAGGAKDLSALLADQGLQDAVQRLLPSDGRLNVLGLVASPAVPAAEGVPYLQGLVERSGLTQADGFHAVVAAAVQIARSGTALPADLGQAADPPRVRKVVQAATAVARAQGFDFTDHAADRASRQVLCFTFRDARAAQWLVEWLCSEAVRRLYEPDQLADLHDCLAMVAHPPAGSMLRPADLQDSLAQGSQYKPQIDALLQFTAACRKVVDDSGPSLSEDRR